MQKLNDYLNCSIFAKVMMKITFYVRRAYVSSREQHRSSPPSSKTAQYLFVS